MALTFKDAEDFYQNVIIPQALEELERCWDEALQAGTGWIKIQGCRSSDPGSEEHEPVAPVGPFE